MKWEKIVEIQYDAIQRSSVVYIAIISIIAGFLKYRDIFLNDYVKIVIVLTFFFILAQNLLVLFLTNTQRKSSWNREHGINSVSEDKKENIIRNFVLTFSLLSTIFLFITIFLLIFL